MVSLVPKLWQTLLKKPCLRCGPYPNFFQSQQVLKAAPLYTFSLIKPTGGLSPKGFSAVASTLECTAFSFIGLKKALETFSWLYQLLPTSEHSHHPSLASPDPFSLIGSSSIVSALVVLLSCTWAPGSCLGHILMVEVIRRIILPSIRTSAVHRVPTRVRPSWHKSSPFDLSSLRIFNFPQVNARLFHYLGWLLLR